MAPSPRSTEQSPKRRRSRKIPAAAGAFMVVTATVPPIRTAAETTVLAYAFAALPLVIVVLAVGTALIFTLLRFGRRALRWCVAAALAIAFFVVTAAPVTDITRGLDVAPRPQAVTYGEFATIALRVVPDTLVAHGAGFFAVNGRRQVVELARGLRGRVAVRVVSRKPLPPVTAMRWCAGSLVVAFAQGGIGRLSKRTGAVTRMWDGPERVGLECTGDRVYAILREAGLALRLDAFTLESLSPWVPVSGSIDTAAAAYGLVFLGDRSAGRVGVLDILSHVLDRPKGRLSTPTGLLPVSGALFVTAPRCGRLVDLVEMRTKGRAVPLPAGPLLLAAQDGRVLALGEDSGALLRFDPRAARRRSRFGPVAVAPTALAATRDVIAVADGADDTVRFFVAAALPVRPAGALPERTKSCR